MRPSQKSIIRLEPSQAKQGAEVIARAFQREPMSTYVIPDSTERERFLPWLFGITIRYALFYGRVYTTDAIEGVAIWLSPGNTTFTFGRMLRTGMLAMPFKIGWAAFRRSMNMMDYCEKLHKQSVPGPHWYLLGLGVDPSQQGKGIGGMLMQPVFARADQDGLPCYLETGDEKNVRFYERHGFNITAKGQVPKGGPSIWAMVREPHKERQRC